MAGPLSVTSHIRDHVIVDDVGEPAVGAASETAAERQLWTVPNVRYTD